jgi:hypothetical protein
MHSFLVDVVDDPTTTMVLAVRTEDRRSQFHYHGKEDMMFQDTELNQREDIGEYGLKSLRCFSSNCRKSSRTGGNKNATHTHRSLRRLHTKPQPSSTSI